MAVRFSTPQKSDMFWRTIIYTIWEYWTDMKPYFEYSDTLNSPYEAFMFEAEASGIFPIKPHWHYFMEIIYVTEGQAYAEAGKEHCVLEPGDLMVFYSQVPHSICLSGRFPLHYYVLKFDPMHLNIPSSSLPGMSEILRMVESTPGMKCFFRKKELEHIPMKELFDRLVDVVTHKQFGYDIQAHSLYCMILTELLSLWYKKGFRIREKCTENSDQRALVSAAEYINCHYPEELRVEQIAARAGMSYSSFAAKFRRYYGMSCGTYIRKVRVSHAEELLLQTDYDLSYISQETGFCDCSHLIRAFREEKGTTPRQFRKSSS